MGFDSPPGGIVFEIENVNRSRKIRDAGTVTGTLENFSGKEKDMNPAALFALLSGDLENALIASTPGGIEAQEAQGQADFVANETLPRKCGFGTTRQQIEAIGIVFGENVDDLFVSVKLPEGWRKSATGHSMHNDLLDEKGRRRASIFYKAAFYDRSASIDLCNRYRVSVNPVTGWDDPDYRQSGWHCVVSDCESVISTSGQIEPEPPYDCDEQRAEWLAWHDKKDGLAKSGQSWLDEHYPDWRDPVAYWD